MPLGIGAKRSCARRPGRGPFLFAWPVMLMVVTILVDVQTSALLVNYQSANLGLLPNGYNAAASNLAANQQLQQQQAQQQQQQQQLQQQQQQQQQQQDPNQYHPMDLSDGQQQQQQVQDQFAQQNSMAQYQNGGNHLLQQYSARNNNNLQQQQQQAIGGISERETGPIFRFHGSALNGSIVKLFWSLESGYVADTFEIKYGPLKNHEMFSLALNGSAREATISSLQPDTDHQFTLYGFSGENGGQFWRPRFLKIKTPRLTDQPSSMPRPPPEDDQLMPLGVKAEAKSHQSIQLSWTEQERPASVSKHNSKRVNQIRYHVAEDPSSQLQQQAKPGEAANGQTDSNSTTTGQKASIKYNYLDVNEIQNRDNRVAIHKLKPGTEYVFAVKTLYVSANDPKKIHRHSSFSMETSARTFDLEPSAPRNFTIQPMQLTQDDINMGSTVPKLRLSWAPPESPNGQLRGYVILFAHEPNLPEDKWMKIMVNDSSADEWSIGRVTPGRSYYFKMRSVNQRGQGPDTETRLFIAPSPPLQTPSDRLPAPIPPNNLLLIIVLCLITILFVLFLVVSALVCRCRSNSRSSKARRKGSLQLEKTPNNDSKLNNAFAQANANNSQCSSTVAGRVGTLARRSRQNDPSNNSKPDFWISAMDQQQAIAAAAASANNSEIKSNISEKSGSDINMAAMVSIQRDSPQQFTTQTTQLTPMLPEYRFASTDQQLMQQIQQQQQQQQQQSHYHTGHHHQFGSALGFDQMDNATASALMTLSKRQQQQLQKYQIQFASTAGATGGVHSNQAPSPHQQPPPPPPLNIEQQQQQQQPLYGTHHQSGTHLNSTRSLRLHRPTLYDPVSGSFVQQDTPPNYNSHLNSMLNGVHHQLQSFNNQTNNSNPVTSGSNTLQFHHHPHQTSTLMSRRSTNTLRSFQSSGGGGGGGLYGHLGGQFAAPPVPPTSGSGGPPHLLQNHQAVINQLNQASYPSLPLKHVSTVRPQIMSSLEDQIEMELAEKQAEQQHLQSQQQQQHQPGPPPSMQQQQQDQPT